MATDIGRHVMRPQFAFDQLHRREDRPFRTTSAEAGWPWRHFMGQRLDLVRIQHGRGIRQRRPVAQQARRMSLKKADQALLDHTGGIFARQRKHILA